MARYFISASYSEEGARGLRKDGGTKREHVTRLAIESLGGKLEAFYFAFGAEDVVVIADFPGRCFCGGAQRGDRYDRGSRCRTTQLLTPAEMDKAVSKSGGPSPRHD